jgi:ATP-dependent Lhr-like helicase
MVIARRAFEENLEPVEIPNKPYDVLVHQISGLLMKDRFCSFQQLLESFRNSYPYRNLAMEELEKVLDYMDSRLPRLLEVSFENRMVFKPRQASELFRYYFENLSMIPFEKQYLIIDESSDTAIGILDEAFVAEYGKPGVKFIIRGSPWIIRSLSEDKVCVEPVNDPTGSIPKWVGEEIPIPFDVAQEVGRLRGFVEEQIKKQVEIGMIVDHLANRYPANRETILRSIQVMIEHAGEGYQIPTDKRITIEEWEDVIIIHCHFGSLTNRSLAQLIGNLLSQKTGHTVLNQCFDLFSELEDMTDFSLRRMLSEAMVRTGLFKRRIIQSARRIGAIEKWADFSRVSLQTLARSFEDTIIYDEALNEMYTKDLDVNNLIRVFKEIHNGKTEISKLVTRGEATPIARLDLERINMKTDIIPSDMIHSMIVQSAKARLLNETRIFICSNAECSGYIEMIRIRDLPNNPTCPICESSFLGVLHIEEDAAYRLMDRKEAPKKSEIKYWKRIVSTANLIAKYGKQAAIVLVGKGLTVSDAETILHRKTELTNDFYDLIIEVERERLKRRFEIN